MRWAAITAGNEEQCEHAAHVGEIIGGKGRWAHSLPDTSQNTKNKQATRTGVACGLCRVPIGRQYILDQPTSRAALAIFSSHRGGPTLDQPVAYIRQPFVPLPGVCEAFRIVVENATLLHVNERQSPVIWSMERHGDDVCGTELCVVSSYKAPPLGNVDPILSRSLYTKRWPKLRVHHKQQRARASLDVETDGADDPACQQSVWMERRKVAPLELGAKRLRNVQRCAATPFGTLSRFLCDESSTRLFDRSKGP